MVTFVTRHAQPVVVCFVCHSKRVVLCVSRVPVKVLQLNSQLVVGLTCQSVDLVQPEPELAAQVTEALFVVGPVSVEVDGAVESLLEDSPAPSCFCLVAENVKVLQVIRIDLEDTAGSEAGLVAISAALVGRYKRKILQGNSLVLHCAPLLRISLRHPGRILNDTRGRFCSIGKLKWREKVSDAMKEKWSVSASETRPSALSERRI